MFLVFQIWPDQDALEMSGISCVHAKIPTQSEKEEALQVWWALEQVLSYLTAWKMSLLLKLQKL